MLGVARYRLGGNFIAFFNLRDDKVLCTCKGAVSPLGFS